MKRLLYFYILILFSLLTFFFYSGLNRISELNSLGTSGINWYVLLDERSIYLNDVYDALNEENALLSYSTYSIDNKNVYKIYYNDNYRNKLYNATNNYLEFKFDELNDKAKFLNSNGVFGTDLTLEEVNSLLGVNEVVGYSGIAGYEGFLYLNIGIIMALLIVTLLINYLLCSYNRKEQAIMITLGFSEQKILKKLFKSVVVMLLISILVTMLSISGYLLYKGVLNKVFIKNLLVFDFAAAIMFVILFFLSYNKFKINRAVLYLKNFNGLKNGTFMLYTFKVILSFVLCFSLSQISILNQEIDENLENLEKYSELGNYYGFNGYTRNFFKLDNNNKYFQEKRESFDEFNEGVNSEVYYILFSYYDFIESIDLDDDSINDNLKEIAKDYSKNYIEVNANFINNFIEYDNQIQFNSNELYLLIPDDYMEYSDEILKVYNGMLLEKKDFHEEYYDITIEVDSNIREVHTYSNDIVSQTNIFNVSDYEPIDSNTIFVINSNLVKPGITETSAYFYESPNFKEFYDLVEEASLLDLTTPSNMLDPYRNEINDLNVIMLWNNFATLLVSVVFFILVINSIMFYIELNRKSHAIKVMMGYSLFKILKNNFILNLAILLNLVIGFILNYHYAIMLLSIIIYIFDSTLLYIVGKNIIYKSLSNSIKGGQNGS